VAQPKNLVEQNETGSNGIRWEADWSSEVLTYRNMVELDLTGIPFAIWAWKEKLLHHHAGHISSLLVLLTST
jgi:hypothetical protein